MQVILIYELIAYIVLLLYLIDYQTNHHKYLIETHHPRVRSNLFHWDEALLYIIYALYVTSSIFGDNYSKIEMSILMIHSLFLRWFFHSFMLTYKRGISNPWNYTGVNVVENDAPDSSNDKILYNIQKVLGIKPIVSKIIFYLIYLILSTIYLYKTNL